MPPHPGEVWLADVGLAAKTRPVVIVSRDDPDPPRALILYVPLTTQHRQSLYEVVLPRLPFLEQNSVANVQGLGSLPIVRLERRLGMVPNTIMAQIKRALAFALDVRAEAKRGRLHCFVRCGVGLRLVVRHKHLLEHGKMLPIERHQGDLPLSRRRSDEGIY